MLPAGADRRRTPPDAARRCTPVQTKTPSAVLRTGEGALPQAAVHMPYFFLNLSTRPPVSTNFCWPVKNGWHTAQISTRRFFLTEPVSNVFPQEQVTVVTWY